MKKTILVLALVGISLVGSVASAATTLSMVTPNVIAATTSSATTLLATPASEWYVVPAQSVYVNNLNVATPNANYPLLTSANIYKVSVGKTGRLIILAAVNGNVTFIPKGELITKF